MTIELENVSNSTSTGTNFTSLSWSHTIATIDSTILVVGVSWRNSGSNTHTVSSVTFNGVALTLVRKDEYFNGDSKSSAIYYLVNPPSGAHTVQATFSGTVFRSVCGSISFTGVDQTNPINVHTGQTDATYNTNISTSITPTVANTVLVDNVCIRRQRPIPEQGASQTLRWSLSSGGGSSNANGSGSTQVRADTSQATMSWTTEANCRGWAHSIVALAPVVSSEYFVRSAGAAGASFSIDVGSPNADRLLVVHHGQETQSSNVTSVTVDGKNCALVLSTVNTIGAGNMQEMWYIDEAGLGASTGSVTVQVVGASSSAWSAAQLFEGVLGGAPFHVGHDNTSGAISTLTVNGMQCPANSLVVAGFGQGYSAPGIVASVTAPLEQRFVEAPSSATLAGYSGVETLEVTNKTYVLTWTDADQYRGTAIIAAWPPADYVMPSSSSQSSGMIL